MCFFVDFRDISVEESLCNIIADGEGLGLGLYVGGLRKKKAEVS
jgi:hypothetical protein